TSIPPHSNTLNKLASPALAGSTPTTSTHQATSFSACICAFAQFARCSLRIPLNSMHTRVTTSGCGDMLKEAARSYAA
ncbi:hypothetical protein BDR03DRAFT_958245, partial [Suillus americanus]